MSPSWENREDIWTSGTSKYCLGICAYLNLISAKPPNFKTLQPKKTGKCINHDFARGYLATVMRCLASYPTCILMGHKLFWFFWGFTGSREGMQQAPSLVFRTEKSCTVSHLFRFAVSTDWQGEPVILDCFRTASKVILKEEATDWLMPTVLLMAVSEFLTVRSPEVIGTIIATGNTWRRWNSHTP